MNKRLLRALKRLCLLVEAPPLDVRPEHETHLVAYVVLRRGKPLDGERGRVP